MTKARRTRSKTGLPPGTVVHVGETRHEPARISLIAYDKTNFHESQPKTIDECLSLLKNGGTKWINIDGIHEVEIVQKLGEFYHLHPLVLEDIVNTTQRPKAEDYGETIFLVAKMLTWDAATGRINSEQLSFILGDNFLLTFQETPGDIFDIIRDRLRCDKGRVRGAGADYLLYCLLDCILDYYFVVLENIGDRIEELENIELFRPSPDTLKEVHRLKREMITLRKAAWPLREVTNSIERGKNRLVSAETSLYFRDLYDHTIRAIETAETYRDMLSGLMDLYLSSVSNKMNEIMKVLTIIATIFIPLTFIAGVYGMNFDPDSSPFNMPELRWFWGYPAALVLMAAVAIGMLVFFKKKKWL